MSSDGNVSTRPVLEPILVSIDDLVLDRALQCRQQMNQATVDEYTAVLQETPNGMPPLRVVDVLGTLYVVDGWHRLLAHRARGHRLIACLVEPGDRRDALAAAVAANTVHGLPRTNEDKRRAIEVLLMDAEWCTFSSRELAKMAGVSHTQINQYRTFYCLEKGEVLTSERYAEISGKPPKAWQDLMDRGSSYGRPIIDRLRAAQSPKDVVKAVPEHHGEVTREAVALRLAELACQPWPWPEDLDEEARRARCRSLDTLVDLDRALSAADCPDREGLIKVLDHVVVQKTEHYLQDRYRGALAGRPQLLAAYERKIIKAQERNGVLQPWDEASRVHGLTEAAAQAAALDRLSDAAMGTYLDPKKLIPSVRDGHYRRMVAPDGGERCADPCCSGWVVPQRSCVVCGKNPTYWRKDSSRVLCGAADLLLRPGVGVRIEVPSDDGPATTIVLDLETLNLLADLHELPNVDTHTDDPEEVLEELRPMLQWLADWRRRSEPVALFAGVDADAPVGE